MEFIEESVKKLIMERAKIAPDTKIKEMDDLIYDLGMDSLSLVELIIDLEVEFGLEIDENDMNQIYKYGSLVKYIENKLKK